MRKLEKNYVTFVEIKSNNSFNCKDTENFAKKETTKYDISTIILVKIKG